MKINSGKLKNKTIPFKNTKFNNAETTTQKVKEAYFTIIGRDLENTNFLDLYACSGQMGLEALSLGAKYVVFNEINKKRFTHLIKIKEVYSIDNNISVYNLPMSKCLKILRNREIKFDNIFIDPPYIKERGEFKLFAEIFDELIKYPVYNDDTIIAIQAYSKNILRDEYHNFEKLREKEYGSTKLHFYATK